MTTPVGDDSNDLHLPTANALMNIGAALVKLLRHASPSPSDARQLRVAKHCFRVFLVATVTAGAGMLVLQPPAEDA